MNELNIEPTVPQSKIKKPKKMSKDALWQRIFLTYLKTRQVKKMADLPDIINLTNETYQAIKHL